ncbi:hypothetical protein GALL_71540 [mine drainage metagenome]|uniref:Uncharacterized protein n=1 Tax=mine drainage metagenome TaxID=410659 RepID=A0A1J5SRA9_9ZZZZ
MAIPANLIQGDSSSWTDDPFTDAAGNVYESGTYALRYELRGPAAAVTLSSTQNGTGWQTSLSTAVSATLAAGVWFWAAILTATNQRITIARGEITVAADISTVTANYDGRSVAEIALSQAENALATWRSSSGRVKKYTIGSRSMEFEDSAQILTIISYWRLRVSNERKQRSISDGLGDPSKLLVRFQ